MERLQQQFKGANPAPQFDASSFKESYNQAGTNFVFIPNQNPPRDSLLMLKEEEEQPMNEVSSVSMTSNTRGRKKQMRAGRMESLRANGINVIGNEEGE